MDPLRGLVSCGLNHISFACYYAVNRSQDQNLTAVEPPCDGHQQLRRNSRRSVALLGSCSQEDGLENLELGFIDGWLFKSGEQLLQTGLRTFRLFEFRPDLTLLTKVLDFPGQLPQEVSIARGLD